VIAEQFGVRLWMYRLDYLACRQLAADTGRQGSSTHSRTFMQPVAD
jgi:hypothetical protein